MNPTRTAPLTSPQRRLWFLAQMFPDSTEYHVTRTFALRGDLDVGAFTDALHDVVSRQGALRTRFVLRDDEPVQEVVADWRPRVAYVDLAGDDLPIEERERRAEEILNAQANRLFDLSAAPPFAVTLIRLAGDRHVFGACAHHLIIDGWSVSLLESELAAAYSARRRGERPDLPALPLQFEDYARAESRRAADGQPDALEYWTRQLAGAQPLQLVTDRPRPPVIGTQGAYAVWGTSDAMDDTLRRLCRTGRATRYVAVLAGYLALLKLHSGQSDISVGMPVSVRRSAELEPLIGYLLNALPVRGDLSGDPTFRDLLGRVRRTVLDSMHWQEVHLEEAMARAGVRRDESRYPLFDTMLIVHPESTTRTEFAGLTVEPFSVYTPHVKFDLSVDAYEDGPRMWLVCGFRTDLFDTETVETLLRRLEALLHLGAEDPDASLSTLYARLAQNEDDADEDQTDEDQADEDRAGADVLALIRDRAAAQPDAVAVRAPDGVLGYGELLRRAERLAGILRRHGAAPERVVAVCLPPGADLVVSLLAVMLAGAAYLPLDPAYPTRRMDFLLEDADAALVVAPAGESPVPAGDRTVIRVGPDCWAESGASGPGAETVETAAPDRLAYVIHTSGSTGTPKAVAVPHAALAARVRWMVEAYQLHPGDHVLQFSSVCFDTFGEEVYPCLVAGATLVVPPGGRVELPDFLATVDGQRLTVLDLPTSYWHELVADLDAIAWPPAMRLLIIGGEQARADAVARFRDRFRDRVVLWNTYGPTEATIVATATRLTDAESGRRPPIGRAIGGARTAVRDGQGRPVPTGTPGELWLGGDGLARGYLGRPELTAVAFVEQAGERFYRTGDRVVQRADGVLEYLGRVDDQLKVRGFRVEPGEVEAAIEAHPAVRTAGVTTDGDGRLVAYLVPEPGAGPPDLVALRAHLAGALPAHLNPGAYAIVPALPRTPGGKIDRSALSALDLTPTTPSADRVAPRNDAERLIAMIWANVLGVDAVGVYDDFFQLGGHSLLATRVASRVRALAGVDVPLRSVFRYTTVEALARTVERLMLDQIVGDDAARGDRYEERRPLNRKEEALWLFQRYAPDSIVDNLVFTIGTSAEIDLPTLTEAVRELARRHAALRAIFPEQDGSPVRLVLPADAVVPPVEGVEASRAGLVEALRGVARRPFDLARDLPFRVVRAAIREGGSAICLIGHHIAVDGQVGGAVMPELSAIYANLLGGGAVHRPEPLAELRERPPTPQSIEYWADQLDGLDLRRLALDRARPTPTNATFAGAVIEHNLAPETIPALAALRRQLRITDNMALLAAYILLLARHGAGPDLVVGVPITARGDRDFDEVGYHVNTLPLRVTVDLSRGFRDLAATVRAQLIAGLAHSDASFESVLSHVRLGETSWRAPLFRHMFNFHPPALLGSSSELPDFTWMIVDTEVSRHDLHFVVYRARDELTMTALYSTEIHEPWYAQALVARYELLLRAAAEDPDRPLAELDMWQPAERSQLERANAFADTAATTVAALVARRVAADPHAVALIEPGQRIAVRGRGFLAARAAVIRDHLVGRGVRRGDVVALALPRGTDLAAAVLATWSLGAAYLPLDPTLPDARRDSQLRDAQAHATLTADDLPVDAEASPEALLAGLSTVDADDLAYVIFTSGSTGVPKGVEITHRSLANLVQFFAGYLDIGASDRVLWLTTFGFDISALELLLALGYGGALVVAPDEAQTNPPVLLDLVTRYDVVVAQTTPTIWRLVAAHLGDELSGRKVLCGGEPLSAALAGRLLRSGCRLFNVYGPTETTIWSTVAEIGPDVTDPVSVGTAVSETSLFVIDAHGQDAPPGVVGELCIGGTGVARGYAARPELTAERFRHDDRRGRYYRTGDMATWWPDGTIELLGRADRQVKLRGRRIELGEIEATLERHPAVAAAAVVVQGDPQGAGRLVGYLQPAGEVDAGFTDQVRRHAGTVLPYYLVPADLVRLDRLPRTASGKVDYRALPRVPADPQSTTDDEVPTDPLVIQLMGMFAEVLGQNDIGQHTGFFACGGHSVLAAMLVSRIAERVGRAISLPDLFAAPTPYELAKVLRGSGEPGA